MSNYERHRKFPKIDSIDALKLSTEFYEMFKTRRSIRHFSDRPVPRDLVINAVKAAGCAPSGANKQPWFFGIIYDPILKSEIRRAAEIEEDSFYRIRAGDKWLSDLKPLGTDAHKVFIEKAPYLIAVFSKSKDFDPESKTETQNYYPLESTCIATGILITSLHNSGLGTLTYTPKPMRFLNRALNLDNSYRPIFIVGAGYPEEDVRVPKISRKPFEEIAKVF